MKVVRILCLVLCSSAFVHAEEPAPAWDIDNWYNLPQNVQSLNVEDLRGKIVYVFCFQAWSPSCHSKGIPVVKKVLDNFYRDPKVAVIMVQTTWERFDINDLERAKAMARYYEMDAPVGQSGTAQKPSAMIERYKIESVPWNILIDHKGEIQHNGKLLKAKEVVKEIKRLKRVAQKK